MARNEEKQQGKLNRLWLQKEREEGRLKDVHVRRPKLSTLNSASSVKKWIPSVKNEIEYYLQQSQLSHYPERKIAEFQLRIEALEKEYKSFISKLRLLDPSCKHKPWTPRAYCKRRAETQDCPSVVKTPRPCESHNDGSQQIGGERDLAWSWTGCHKTSETQQPLHSETRLQTPFSTKLISEPSETVCADQDQPLSFDHTKLSVAVAAFRGPSLQQGSSQTQSLVKVLQSGLPNLVNNSFTTQSKDSEKDDRATVGSVDGQRRESAERIPGKSSIPGGTTEERTGHVLGLGCYSSSDEECQA